MQFIDEVVIEVKAGRGGSGCVAFRREKFKPWGGPCGGNGGKGGDIVIVGDEGLSTLIELHYSSKWRARNGEHGKGKDMFGRSAPPTIIRVPVGTIIKDEQTGEILADIVKHGQEFIAAKGGRGGRGNLSFKSNKCPAPDFAEKGEEGEERRLRLELKLIADVGIVGFPNAGKSTLLGKVSAAKPRVADYPFTTLVPNLGVVRLDETRSFVIADMPGIIDGAAEGAGLGHRFLRHIERTKIICLLLAIGAPENRNLMKTYKILVSELEKYSPALAEKPRIVAINKIDIEGSSKIISKAKRDFEKTGIEIYPISALTGKNVKMLMEKFWEKLVEVKK